MSDQDYLVPPRPAPDLNIPSSSSTVSVSIVDTGARVDLPMNHFLVPDVRGKTRLSGPAYSFLITHPSGRHILFDLSVRKDFQNLAPRIAKSILDPSKGWKVYSPKNVADVLAENDVKLDEIEAIIWSHYHWDHTGDPSVFPATTDLVVGPGFKDALLPGWPEREDAVIKEDDYKGRTLREIDFEKEGNGLKIGRFNALDFFGDGSFYLLDSPGHAVGHMCGLARVTAGSGGESFVLMGGDCCHHGGEFRPTQYLPLPRAISPSPIPKLRPGVCPGHLFQHVHPSKSADKPYYTPTQSFPHDFDKCIWSIEGCEEFDASDDVLLVVAHDASLLRLFKEEELFMPHKLDGWKEKALNQKGRWRFLGDFEEAVDSGT